MFNSLRCFAEIQIQRTIGREIFPRHVPIERSTGRHRLSGGLRVRYGTVDHRFAVVHGGEDGKRPAAADGWRRRQSGDNRQRSSDAQRVDGVGGGGDGRWHGADFLHQSIERRSIIVIRLNESTYDKHTHTMSTYTKYENNHNYNKCNG